MLLSVLGTSPTPTPKEFLWNKSGHLTFIDTGELYLSLPLRIRFKKVLCEDVMKRLFTSLAFLPAISGTLLFAFFLANSSLSFAQTTSWQWLNPYPQGNTLKDRKSVV